MENVFVCADLHFNHSNIITYENRPFSTREEMNEKLIEYWNAVVGTDDHVFVLGDVGFAGNAKLSGWIHQLNGHKFLIPGNHDKGRSFSKWREIGFEDVYEQPIYMQRNGVQFSLTHEPPEEPLKPGIFYLYGHVHGSPDFPDHTAQSACVSIERLNYRPALVEDVYSGAAYKHRHNQQ